ncbi:MAG: LytR C-terminal domain-containing protein [Bowdeniella nasicola]|nr:LytR C-terminal domain-containing protein [Bowdeniella nasicola]
MTHYEEDEFDVAARDRGPTGVHRRLEPAWRRYLPFLIAIIVAPLLAWGAVQLLSAMRSDTSDTPTPVATETSEETTPDASPSPEQNETPAESAQPSESPEQSPELGEDSEPNEEDAAGEDGEDASEPDLTATVTILNGTRINGLAGRAAEALRSDGFTSVVPDNYRSATPAVDTVYYHSEAQKAAAEKIAQTFGIDRIVESASSTQSIAVVLRTDVLN